MQDEKKKIDIYVRHWNYSARCEFLRNSKCAQAILGAWEADISEKKKT